ncbi:hypothetical protein FRX31_007953 [Thalictrum thalictroides]|uniref:Retrotransposon gag domain-containing protein n=1 Tax=Thalictrum thalictroides TaxID=46969 RepID=A0A7J6WZH2_THATH|nr:hypothetical protein FRX31_007953 [Thalictrum thalictroides]
MTASKYKQSRRIPPRYTPTRRRFFEDNEISESELPQKNVYKDQDDDEEDEYEDNSATYSKSDVSANAPRNEYYSPEDSESIPETSPPDIASVNSASNFQDHLQDSSHTPMSYVNIAPLPIFRGTSDECPVTHLSRFSKVCRANNVHTNDMIMRIFPVTLDDDAALWYDLVIEPHTSFTWEEIKSSFLNMYRRMEFIDKYRSELMTLKQGENESVFTYFLRMQGILRKWSNHGIRDEVLKGLFIDGLREDFQDWIDPQKPETLDEALKLALQWEETKSIRALRNKKYIVINCGFCDGPHEERVCEIREKMRELWFKIREKQLREKTTSTSSPESDKDVGVKKDLVRTGSIATSNVGEDGDVMNCKRKSQRQCWKHQCWKKKLERNNSILSRNSKAD